MDPAGASSASPSGGQQAQDWTRIPAQQLVQHQSVIQIDSELPIEEACEVLIKAGISSAPIYDAKARAYIGMFDYRDLITYLLIVIKQMAVPTSQQTLEVKTLIRKAAQMQQVPVRFAADLSTQNPFYSIVPETTLSHVVAIFGYGTHRMAVVDEQSGAIDGILSQSTVIHFLSQHLAQFPTLQTLAAKTLQELQLAESTVFTVNASSRVMDAMKAMVDYGVTSLAVVDSDDNAGLLGNISLTDIKYIMKHRNHAFLWKSCMELIQFVHLEQGAQDGQDKATVFCVSPSTTLARAMALLAATHAHRLWVTTSATNTSGASVVGSPSTISVVANPPHPSVSPVKHGLAHRKPSATLHTSPPRTASGATPNVTANMPSPLTTSGRVVGIISLTDVLRALTPTD
ncbi:cell separation during budding [Dimargaris verticillata]|uniref:Cell separation during budding n=1 Tax=Dimargaris verticillata TaxID=2761393 RepID=A0A9W8B340_9FUNG|nr:cell separation during budding [Dimargaris verticillata]